MSVSAEVRHYIGSIRYKLNLIINITAKKQLKTLVDFSASFWCHCLGHMPCHGMVKKRQVLKAKKTFFHHAITPSLA